MTTMEHVDVAPEEYGRLFPSPLHVYNTVAFSELNSGKCEAVKYMVFREGKIRGGIVLGLRDGMWQSPFSAPFGGFTLLRGQRMEYIEHMARCMSDFADAAACPVRIVFPPVPYDDSLITKSVSAFSRMPQCVMSYDVSYHYDLRSPVTVSRKARGALREALRYDFAFECLDGNEADIVRVYDIVRQNHEAKGYPVKMSCREVIDTVRIIPADFFVLNVLGRDVAAAVAFHVSPGIVQLIYWGDIPGTSSMRVMNRMAFELSSYYRDKGLDIMDLGPSTEAAIPNYGLCAFKESWGCRPSLKPQVIIRPSSHI